ncbi:hypothetical protein [Pseudorhodoplanes sp.]|uniref:hypothetical protein n=1 Tax=Pseudorhodoplanes sp. TaxID=1934341 RepID=UPI00391C28D1
MTGVALCPSGVDRRTLLRGAAAGGVWGLVVATALLGLSFYQCGTLCLGQIVDTAALSVASGIVGIGPLVLLRRAEQTSAK